MHKYQTLLVSSCVVLVFGFLLGACQHARSTAKPTNLASPTSQPIRTASTTASTQPHTPSSTPVFVTITPEATPQPSYQAAVSPTVVAYPPPATAIASATRGATTPTLNPNLIVTPTVSPTQYNTASETQTQIAPSPTVTIAGIPEYPGPGENPTVSSLYPEPNLTNTALAYPGPVITDTPQPYPGAEITSTPQGYPGPLTPTQPVTRTPARSNTPAASQSGTFQPFLTPTMRTGTPGVSPTELPPKPPISPPPPGSSVTIWHSWGSAETAQLESIIQSFQRIYPDVTFSLLYVPLDDLHDTYQEAAYLGSGPDLLLGPAKWGPTYYDEKLVTDLSPYIPPDFLTSINPAALTSGEYQQALISLPLSQHGAVIFRNTAIIDTIPVTFAQLEALSQQVTHGGIVGSYLERGSLFSAANIIGLGGSLMDAYGNPTFNNQFGLEWFNLLTDYDVAGAVTFNTNWDLNMFKRGKVGMIVDGTWNIALLTQSIGAENLAIDPWPTYGTGHLSGWVESDSVFLNPSSTGDDRSAALAFIGYLLDPNVQMHLAEVGHIPSVSDTVPRDPLIQQAMRAFSYGSAYPISVDQSVVTLYQKELDKAIHSVFVNGAEPSEALKTASANIVTQMNSTQTSP